MPGVHLLKSRAILTLVLLLLVFSWLALFVWLNGFAILSLIPYDDTAPEARPPADTWQRQLNDFFERPPWRNLPAWFLVGISVLLFITAVIRTSPVSRTRLGLLFAFSNLAVVVAMALSTYILSPLPTLRFLEPGYYRPGYGWTYRFILMDAVLLAGWLFLQARGITEWVKRAREG